MNIGAPAARFLDANRRLSGAVARIWPGGRHDVVTRYGELVADAIRERPRPVVVDIGGGKALEYRDRVEPSEAYIIAVDVSEAELSENTDVDEKRVADVTRALPFDDGEVDVLTSSSVLEHLDELGGFLDEAARVVSEGGLMVHLFPSRYASFAIINRALPETLKRRLLYSLYPNTKGVCGFPANYDHCYASAIVRECERRGFTIEVLELSYYGSSDYYRVFFPVFIVSWVWELLASLVGAKDLAAAVLVKARRSAIAAPAADGSIGG